MKFTTHIFLIISIISFCSVNAQNNSSESPFKIHLHSDFRAYSDENNVQIDASVTNVSDETQEFYRFEKDYTTFQPVVYDMTGREAETTVVYRKDGHTADMMVRGSSPRTITLAPQETFSVRLNLADYYELVPGRKYRVRLLFVPDASRKYAIGGENIYRFTIDDTVYHAEDAKKTISEDGSGTIRPAEVVHLLFTAEENERWRDYLKYIKEDEYVFSFPEYAGKYVSASPAKQKVVLRDFRTWLIRNRPDGLLDFNVLGETVTQKQATVKVRAKRQAPRQPFVYVYTFSLEKYSDFWKITGVEASLSRDMKK